MNQPCPICANQSEISARFEKTRPDTIDDLFYFVSCPRCGEYFISSNVYDYTMDFYGKPSKRKLINLSSSIHANKKIYIHQHNIESLLDIKPDSIEKRAYTLLYHIIDNTEFMGQYITFNVDDIIIQSKTWSLNSSEVSSLLEYWKSKSVLTITYKSDGGDAVCITPHGWSYIDELDNSRLNSTQGFVAMWFDASMTPIYDSTIAPAISKTGYTPHRVDRREHAGKVDDEIIAQIRRSKFMVADFTDHRGGVYYEAGFAHGLGLPVIMTCREDHLNELHFDIRQYNCILWKQDNLKEFQERLQNRIEAILGRGPLIHDA